MVLKEKAAKFDASKASEYAYIFHHDGWFSNLHKKGPEARDSYKIYLNKIKPLLPKVEAALKVNAGLQFERKDADGALKSGQPYVLVLPKKNSSQHSGVTQKADTVRVIKGVTDGQGRTKPVQISGIGEIVLGILSPFIISKLKGKNEVARAEKYTVKRGDSLDKIAKANNSSVEAIAKKNSIKDINKVLVGQELVLACTAY